MSLFSQIVKFSGKRSQKRRYSYVEESVKAVEEAYWKLDVARYLLNKIGDAINVDDIERIQEDDLDLLKSRIRKQNPGY